MNERPILLRLTDVELQGDLAFDRHARVLVVFVHGSGSSRRSGRNRRVAHTLQQRGCATLLFDLLTEQEDRDYENRFDIELLTRRLVQVTDWLEQHETTEVPLAYFGASTGAAAALNAAAERAERVTAVVSRGGRPDLAIPRLERVRAPTLLIVGGADEPVIGLNRMAQANLAHVETRLAIVPGAGHLFEEPGALEQVAELAAGWFLQHAAAPRPEHRPAPHERPAAR